VPAPVQRSNVERKIGLTCIDDDCIASHAVPFREIGARVWTRDHGARIEGFEHSEVHRNHAAREQ